MPRRQGPGKAGDYEWDDERGVRIYTILDVRVEIPLTPWCDCPKVGFGFTKRDDGVWVRPCCMRREKGAWLKFHEKPVPHDYLVTKEREKKEQP